MFFASGEGREIRTLGLRSLPDSVRVQAFRGLLVGRCFEGEVFVEVTFAGIAVAAFGAAGTHAVNRFGFAGRR